MNLQMDLKESNNNKKRNIRKEFVVGIGRHASGKRDDANPAANDAERSKMQNDEMNETEQYNLTARNFADKQS